MKLTHWILIACGLAALTVAVPDARAALTPSIAVEDGGDEEPPAEGECACQPSFSASNLAICHIALYWTAGSLSAGQCADGDCPDEDAEPCKMNNVSLMVVNLKSTPQSVNIWPTVNGTSGNGGKTLKTGESHTKTGIWKSADCGDGFHDYIYVWDMGPFGSDCQASLTFVCGRCPASY